MLFSTYSFIFLFLPWTLIAYFLLGNGGYHGAQQIFLVLMSLVFYAYFNLGYAYIIISSILVNYLIAKFMQRSKNYGLLFFTFGIIFNVGLLGYYKYTDFFITNFNIFTGTDIPLKHILLPLGISFFTFQQFSFLLSIYQGDEKIEGFIDYSLFVTFFPQLIAGPIVLYGEMMPQFKDRDKYVVDYPNIASGIYIFTLGLFKKLVLADTLAVFVDNGFAMPQLGFAAAWVTALSYTFQIYFDFSGYCDMAIGLGKMFNIDLPINFNSPYKSKSISEFWKRWHMTLGRALAHYIYIPLGGNRRGGVGLALISY